MEQDKGHAAPERRADRSNHTARQRSNGAGRVAGKNGGTGTNGQAMWSDRIPSTAGGVTPHGAGTAAPPFDSIFSGTRPQVISRGLDPVFLLVDHGLMEQLHETARRRGTESDYLLRQILREHLDDY